jgi:hypothetical protein
MGISEATYCNWKKRHGRNDWVIRIAAEREPPSRAGARYPAPAQSGESRT